MRVSNEEDQGMGAEKVGLMKDSLWKNKKEAR